MTEKNISKLENSKLNFHITFEFLAEISQTEKDKQFLKFNMVLIATIMRIPNDTHEFKDVYLFYIAKKLKYIYMPPFYFFQYVSWWSFSMG